jgi:hypothetical protein
MDSIKKAKARGIAFGRKKKPNQDELEVLRRKRSEGELVKTRMKDHELSKDKYISLLRSNESVTAG